MARKIEKKLKVVAPAGKATPAPPLGPTLGQAGINISEFTTRFNADTQDRMGDIVPAIITVYDNKSFDIEYKTAPASSLILKAVKQPKGSGSNITKKIGTISKAQVREIAEIKLPDLTANDLDAASKIIEGTCRSMGVEVK